MGVVGEEHRKKGVEKRDAQDHENTHNQKVHFGFVAKATALVMVKYHFLGAIEQGFQESKRRSLNEGPENDLKRTSKT